MLKQHDQLVKLILTGSSGVGKSAILTQFADNKFNETYMTTIGVDFRFKKISDKNRSIKLQIWDTAGQQRFRTITSAYYKGADGIIMVFDQTSQKSLQELQKMWIPQAYNYCDKSIDIYLLGNKSDLDSKMKQQKMNKFVQKHNLKYYSVSAKSGQNVQQSIKQLALKVAKKKWQKNNGDLVKSNQSKSNQSKNQRVSINNTKTITQNKKSCC